jgi:hypothetical protein
MEIEIGTTTAGRLHRSRRIESKSRAALSA